MATKSEIVQSTFSTSVHEPYAELKQQASGQVDTASQKKLSRSDLHIHDLISHPNKTPEVHALRQVHNQLVSFAIDAKLSNEAESAYLLSVLLES